MRKGLIAAMSGTGPSRLTVPGTYTVVLNASDGVHTPAYDATVITVSNGGGPTGTTTTSGTTDSGGGGCGVGSTLSFLIMISAIRLIAWRLQN